jgi:hypothetical protein
LKEVHQNPGWEKGDSAILHLPSGFFRTSFSLMSVVVLQNHEDEKNSSEFFAVAGAPLTYQYRTDGGICFDYEIFQEGNTAQLFARFSSGAFYAGFGREQKSRGCPVISGFLHLSER